MAKTKHNATADALVILRRITGDSARMRKLIEQEHLNAAVARQIYDARAAAGLTQRQLASLVGTSHSVTNRLEDADYEGHSLNMLKRIAAALNQRIEVRLVPAPKTDAPARRRRVA